MSGVRNPPLVAEVDLSGYLTETDAAATYAPLSSLAAHASDSTGVHGIADTADLATDSDVSAAVAAAASALSTHEADTTNVHGIANTATLVLTSDARLSDQRVPTDGSVTNAKVAAAAAIAYSKLDLANSIVNADVAGAAGITYAKLATLNTGQLVVGNAGTATATTLGGDATIGATGTLTIANSAITNAKVAAGAAIAYSKLDLAASIVNADVASGAAISMTKVDKTTAVTWTAAHRFDAGITLGNADGDLSRITTDLIRTTDRFEAAFVRATGMGATFTNMDTGNCTEIGMYDPTPVGFLSCRSLDAAGAATSHQNLSVEANTIRFSTPTTANGTTLGERVRVPVNVDGLQFGASQDAQISRAAATRLSTTGTLDAAGTIRSTGTTGFSSTGAGVEMYYQGGGNILAYDRGASTYQVLNLFGSTVQINASGTARIKVDGTGIGFFNVTPVARPAAITAPSGGTVIDAEARTAINSIRTALTNLGLTS